MKFSIIIPSWNGKELLSKNLPAVLKSSADEVVVVDNGSTDGSVLFLEELQSRHSQLKTIFNGKNLGFVRAVNQGVDKAQGEIVVLLNNDVAPEKDFLKPLVKDFQDEKVFAVSLNEPQWSWAKGQWIKGFVEHQVGQKTEKPHFSFWANGGSAAFRKSIWQELGGLDKIFAPFYWEDIDLSYRAWKRGYQVLWDPQAIVYHRHQGTIGRHFSKFYVNYIAQRNQLLFIWKNITSFKKLFEHHLFLMKRLLIHPGYWRPFLSAWLRLYLIFPRWLKEFREKKTTDQAIFKLFN